MGTLPEPESGTKRPKLDIPKYDAFAIVLSIHKRFCLSEVLIWFRDGAFRDGHWAQD